MKNKNYSNNQDNEEQDEGYDWMSKRARKSMLYAILGLITLFAGNYLTCQRKKHFQNYNMETGKQKQVLEVDPNTNRNSELEILLSGDANSINKMIDSKVEPKYRLKDNQNREEN
ncbi:MAG: hypothetical protein ACP5OG_04130 [Candidatus Nanoarchaeia archaeon]